MANVKSQAFIGVDAVLRQGRPLQFSVQTENLVHPLSDVIRQILRSEDKRSVLRSKTHVFSQGHIQRLLQIGQIGQNQQHPEPNRRNQLQQEQNIPKKRDDARPENNPRTLSTPPRGVRMDPKDQRLQNEKQLFGKSLNFFLKKTISQFFHGQPLLLLQRVPVRVERSSPLRPRGQRCDHD